MSIQEKIWRLEDQLALDVHDLLREKYNELAKEVGYYSNVVGVFFHQLMIYTTNYVLIKHANETYVDPVEFPFLNTEYVTRPFNLEFNNQRSMISLKTQLLLWVSKLLGGNRKIAYSKVSQGYRFLLKFIGKAQLFVIVDALCFLREKDHQLMFLRDVLTEVAQIVDANNVDIYVQNFVTYVESLLRDVKPDNLADFLIVGTNLNIHNRINSANYLEAGKQVISIFHGEQCTLTHDDLVMGYGELSYSNYLISYGSHQAEIGKYNKPLYKKPIILQRSSEIINSYYHSSHIPFSALTKQTKVLYAPTQFSGRKRYGPFRDLDTALYKRWQEIVLNLDLDITYKPHPKSKVAPVVKAQKVETAWLQDCILDYDFYFLDFISTGSALAVATDKPIIYFNLGLMNLSDDALRDFKNRVFWIDIDLDGDLELQILSAIDRYNRSQYDFVNYYTEKYSLDLSRRENTVDIIQQIIEP